MELILKKDVQNLGFKDDLVTVKNGYGRNFLIPQGVANEVPVKRRGKILPCSFTNFNKKSASL